MSDNPEISKSIDAGGITTNYHDEGSGSPVVLLHGSGPGVSAWANWRPVLPALAEHFRVVAPDIVGFGFTERPDGIQYTMDNWTKHAVDFLDAMEIEQADIVGNSFGGALAETLAIRHHDRVRRLVLMGSGGVQFELTEGLDIAWGYTPSIENMKQLLDLFAYSRELVTDELAELRYKASMRPGIQEAYSQMFPAPRQNGINELAPSDDELRALEHQTLIVHGREDRIIPPAASRKLFELLPNAQLHMFAKCGHWTQIEHTARFNQLVINFFSES